LIKIKKKGFEIKDFINERVENGPDLTNSEGTILM
jgi:hypothetical protein